MTSNIIEFGGHQVLRAKIGDLQLIEECTYRPSVRIESLLSSSKSAGDLYNHLNAYPIFQGACIAVNNVIGSTLGISGNSPLLVEAMDSAVSAAIAYQREVGGSTSQIQSLLANELCERVSKIAEFDLIGLDSSGELTRWDLRYQTFDDWARKLQRHCFVRTASEYRGVSRRLGFKIRLMAVALDDVALGMALQRRI